MKKTYSFLLLLMGAFIFTSCLSIAPTSISRNGSLEGYRFFYVTPTAERNSVNGDTWGTRGNTYGSTTSSSVNPADLIAGYLMGRGACRRGDDTDSQRSDQRFGSRLQSRGEIEQRSQSHPSGYRESPE